MEEIIVGVVGVLQFDVLKYRLENEYNVDIRLENLPYEHIRWIENEEEIDLDQYSGYIRYEEDQGPQGTIRCFSLSIRGVSAWYRIETKTLC